MIVRCPTCQKRLRVPPALDGRRIACNACRTPIDTTTVAVTPAGDAPPPSTAEIALPPDPPAPRRRAGFVPVGDPDPADRKAWRDRALSAGAALVVQLLVFLVLGLAGSGPRAAGESAGPTVALGELDTEQLTNTDDGQLEEASAGGGADAADELTTSVDVAVSPVEIGAAEAGEVSLSPSGGLSGGSGGGAGGGDGFGFGKGSGLGGEATFLGVPARGHRFCIIADNSGSMSGPPLEYVKAEIVKTMNAARGSAKFYVVFFNSVAVPQPNKKWVGGKDIDPVVNWVRGIRPFGGTSPITGFNDAFTISPPPDVIYFMTDGGFSPLEADQIAQLNAKLKKPAAIHSIAFGPGAAVALLQKIAKDGKGTFRQIAGPGGRP